MEVRQMASAIKPIDDPNALGNFVMPRSEAEYDAAVAQLDALVNEIGDHPNNPRYRLIETLGALIAAYDHEHYPVTDISSIQALGHLMKAHGLRQGDLPEIGSQGVISEILAGRRQLNVRQIRALGKRFNVDPSVFI